VASAGMPGSNGEPPWRPSYGQLDNFWLLLAKTTTLSVLSATITPYVEQLLETKLAMHANQVKLRARLNQLNISYVSLDIVNCLSNFKNLDFLVPDMYHLPMIHGFL
jgi:hypothetical protein